MVGYCIDVGSVAAHRFGWARIELEDGKHTPTTSTSMEALAANLASDLKRSKVTLGFECPLFVPLRGDPEKLTKRRRGEGQRPWSAGAGVSSMGTGIVQTIWLLNELRNRLEFTPPVFVDWSEFVAAETGLHVWEAFVSEKAKATSMEGCSPHEEDACAGLLAFRDALPDPSRANCIDEGKVHSLIGAALLRSGWTDGITLLAKSCLVIRP